MKHWYIYFLFGYYVYFSNANWVTWSATGNRYYISTETLSVGYARAKCNSFGVGIHLVEIEDMTEHNYVTGQLSNGYYWVGLHLVSSQWLWYTTNSSYDASLPWSGSVKTQSSYTGVIYFKSSTFSLKTVKDTANRYICEQSSSSVGSTSASVPAQCSYTDVVTSVVDRFVTQTVYNVHTQTIENTVTNTVNNFVTYTATCDSEPYTASCDNPVSTVISTEFIYSALKATPEVSTFFLYSTIDNYVTRDITNVITHTLENIVTHTVDNTVTHTVDNTVTHTVDNIITHTIENIASQVATNQPEIYTVSCGSEPTNYITVYQTSCEREHCINTDSTIASTSCLQDSYSTSCDNLVSTVFITESIFSIVPTQESANVASNLNGHNYVTHTVTISPTSPCEMNTVLQTVLGDQVMQTVDNTVTHTVYETINNYITLTAATFSKTPDDDTYITCPSDTTNIVTASTLSDEDIRDIVDALHVEKKTTSKFKRSLISADDPRPSAKMVGWAGISIILIVLAGLVCLDLSRVVRFLRSTCYKNENM